MTFLLYLCAAAILLAVIAVYALVVVALVADTALKRRLAREERTRRKGSLTLGALVIANTDFRDGRFDDGPGLLALDLTGGAEIDYRWLAAVADRVGALYMADPADLIELTPAERFVAARVQDDRYQRGRRYKLPRELAGNREVYLADIWLYAAEGKVGPEPLIPCYHTGIAKGEVAQAAEEDPEARALWRSHT